MSNDRIVTWIIGEGEMKAHISKAFLFGGYGDSYGEYKDLVEKAKKDFSELSLDDNSITVSKVQSSDYMDRFICISFLVPVGTKREGYVNQDRFVNFGN